MHNFFKAVTAATAILCSGCGLVIRNKLYNNTEFHLWVYASKGAINGVRPHQTVLLESMPHHGAFSISNQNGAVWVYDEFAFYSLYDGYETWSRIPSFPLQTATKVIAVNPGGTLYLLPRDFLHWDKKNFVDRQPDGFPISPSKKSHNKTD